MLENDSRAGSVVVADGPGAARSGNRGVKSEAGLGGDRAFHDGPAIEERIKRAKPSEDNREAAAASGVSGSDERDGGRGQVSEALG